MWGFLSMIIVIAITCHLIADSTRMRADVKRRKEEISALSKKQDEAAQMLGYEDAFDLRLKTLNADFITPPGISREESYDFYMIALLGDNYNP